MACLIVGSWLHANTSYAVLAQQCFPNFCFSLHRILKTLLAELIEKTVENPKVHPKLLLRRYAKFKFQLILGNLQYFNLNLILRSYTQF